MRRGRPVSIRRPRRIGWWLAGLALMLLARLPAAWLAAPVDVACAGRCALADLDGTIWHGQAKVMARDARGGAVPLLPLAWRFAPAALRHGELAWQLDAPASGRVALRPNGVALQLQTATLAAANLESLLAGRIALARWGGRMTLRVESLTCTWRRLCAGRIDGTWQALRFGSLLDFPLGDYQWAVQRDGNAPWQGPVKATRGPLWVDLALGAEHIDGEAWIDPPARAALAPLIGGIGRYDAQAQRYRLHLPLRLDGGS